MKLIAIEMYGGEGAEGGGVNSLKYADAMMMMMMMRVGGLE